MIVRVFKWGTFVGFALLVSLAVYWTYLYFQIRDSAVRDEAQPADAIVVLGAAQYNGRPSPVLKARLDHANELYKQQYSQAIITTGSYGPDPNFSEAHVSTQYLVQHGVDVANIITEQGSQDNGILAYTSPAPNSPIEVASSQRFWHSVREVILFSAYRWMDL